MKEVERICGNCARWKVPNSGCTYAEDIRKGTITAQDPGCDDFYSAKTKKEKPKKRLLKDSGFIENGCFEAIYHNGKPAFLVNNSGVFNIVESLEVNGETLAPKDLKHVPYEPYGYFEGQVPNREELFWKIRREIQRFVDMESIWHDVAAAAVLLSYHQEKLQTVPYLFLYGDNESGKSTALQILKTLCYRPMYAVTVPAADLYGYLEDSDATGCILEDEVQGIDKDTDKIKIYKAGYKQGATVPRTIMLEHDRIIKYYNTFCFKACASEQIPTVKGFRERFIEIPMVEGTPELEWVDIKTEDLKRLQELRNMLLKWRMLARELPLPDPELAWKGRLKEIWKPLLQITSDLTIYNTLFNFVEEQRKERLSSKQNTLEGHIVKVVSELYIRQPIPFVDIWDALVSELEGKLDDKKPHQMDTSEFFTVTKSRVGYRLREVLSGRSKAIRYEKRVVKGYEFDEKKLAKVAKKYGFEVVTKLPSLPSSEGVSEPKSMEKPYEKHGEKQAYTPLEVGSLGDSVTKVRTVMALDPKYIGPCFFCGKRVTLTWQVQYFNGDWADACEDCGAPLLEQVKAQSEE